MEELVGCFDDPDAAETYDDGCQGRAKADNVDSLPYYDGLALSTPPACVVGGPAASYGA